MHPHDAGMDERKLERAKSWLAEHVGEARFQRYKERHPGASCRVLVVRGGRIVFDWNHGVEPGERLWIWSATKSVYSNMLGILIADGRIESADAPVRDLFSEALDVPDGQGPKPGRNVTAKDSDITLRHLITNTSGYMKDGERPGQAFHYQTYGMNILVHAMERACGLYDVTNPTLEDSLAVRIDRHLKEPLDGTWGYYHYNFDLHAAARLKHFGYFLGMASTALDMARLGLLWLHHGNWAGVQVIPEQWMRETTRTAPDIVAHCPEDQWRYGHGFWTNDYLKLWPALPRDSFAASGAGQNHVWVCPSLDLVVVQSPGLYEDQTELGDGLLRFIVDAVK